MIRIVYTQKECVSGMKKSIYITMDMDWANDGVLADTIRLVDLLDIPVCFFVTNDTPLLSDLRADPHFTLGIHPNFLPHLNGRSSKTWMETLEEMHALVPEARVIRCHALVDATPILAEAQKMGFQADMNLFSPFSSKITAHPFYHFSGIKRLPFFFEDDAWILEPEHPSIESHVLNNGSGLSIFNFHPIHLYLNTETMERYNRAKPFYHDFDKLAPFVNHSEATGARDILLRLKEFEDQSDIRFGSIEELWN